MARAHPVRGLGASDCETLRHQGLAQPVSALSSLAFVLGAGMLARRYRTGVAPAALFSASMAAVGFGSYWYQGPQGRGAQTAHDATIALLLGQAVAVPTRRWARGARVLAPGGRRKAQVAGLLTGTAVAAYAAGRTGSRVCRPDSPWQAHGLWHVLAAAAFTAWGSALWAWATPQ